MSGFRHTLKRSGLYLPLWILRHGLKAGDRERWSELRAFRRDLGGPLSVPTGPHPDGRRILFPHLGGGPLVTMTQGMLAKALEARGARPVFVIFDDVWHEEYLRTFGFEEFIYVDEFLPSRERFEALADEMLAKCQSVDDVLLLVHDNIDVGRNAASRTVKDLRRGSLDLTEPRTYKRLREALVSSLQTGVAAREIVADVDPAHLFVSEQGYTPWAEFYDVALQRGVDVLHWYRSPFEHSLLFRRYTEADRHEHFFTIADESWAQLKNLPWSHEDGERHRQRLVDSYLEGKWFVRKNMLEGKREKTRDELVAELGLDPAKKLAVIFSHVLFDATFWFGTSLFDDYGVWLLATISQAIENPNVNWVIKMHPENVTKAQLAGEYRIENLEEHRLITSAFPELPPHVVLMPPENDTNPVSLFDIADYAITVRGTIGLEYPCFGTPTLTAGTGGYSGRGFTLDSSSVDEYYGRLGSIEDIPSLSDHETELAQRFSNAVFFLKPIPITSWSWTHRAQAGGGHFGPFDFSVAFRDAGDLLAAPDLEVICSWALDSHATDLLMPAGPREPVFVR